MRHNQEVVYWAVGDAEGEAGDVYVADVGAETGMYMLGRSVNTEVVNLEVEDLASW